MQRRHFIRKSAIALVTAAGAVAAVSYLRQFFPRRVGEKRKIPIGDLAGYPVDTFTFLEEHKIFVYRDHEGIRAVSAVCTHLGCMLEKTPDGFECPCHGSSYNMKGEVLSGPAPRDLSWYQVSGSPEGQILVDPGRVVEPEDIYTGS
jgi:cytochrome b6-f complex iron-sulfur subunit